MLTIDGKQYRNLEEQVRKNKEDIQSIIDASAILNAFGIKVVGQVDTSDKLPNPADYPGEYGDAYLVGTATPYDYYIFTRPNDTHPTAYWLNIGEFPLAGPQGETGPQGPQGPKGDGSKWYAGTQNPTIVAEVNDQYLNTADGSVFSYSNVGWTRIGNIRGPQGVQGNIGPVGPTGAQGVQGPVGPKGDPGNIYKIIAVLDNIGQLPTPSEYTRNNAYIIDNHLYAIVGEEFLEWVDFGVFSSVQGPQGPQGIQGPTGPTAGSNPNLLINGDFRVNQRGKTSYTGTGYTVDRWRNLGFNNLTVTPLVSGLRLEDTVDTGTGYVLSYKFEDKDYLKLQSKTITISFKVSKNTGSNIYLRLLANEEIVGNTNNTNNTGIFSTTITLPNSLNSLDLQIRKSNGELNCEIEYVKLELGSVATSFSPRPYAEELAMCQRYYQNINTISSLLYARTTEQLRAMVNFKTEMRTTPTLTQLNTIRVYGINERTTFAQTSVGIGGATSKNKEGAMVALLNYSGLTEKYTYQFDLGVSTEPIFTADAEIY